MNVAIFITRENAKDIERMAESLSERQFEHVNGALFVIHEARVSQEEAKNAVSTLLSDIFPVKKIMSVPIATGTDEDRKSGILFHNFAVNGYCKFPGPWLLIDSFSASVARNPITIMSKHHEAAGKLCSGRPSSNLDIRNITPVGPVSINLPFARIVYAGYIARGWRETLSRVINRALFHCIPDKDYPFSDTETDEEKEVEVKESENVELSFLENLSDEELDIEYENAIGNRPHVRAKRSTKISRILEMQ